jgi:lysophospholipase L1-like esterase
MVENPTRRKFLIGVSAAAASLLISRETFPLNDGSRPFDILVIGDSLVWGQGLNEEQKFYRITKEWIRDEVWAGLGPVQLKVKAHSGATINLPDEEASALLAAERDLAKGIHPEINVSFPTIKKQLQAARSEYIDPLDVRLVILSGGVPEVGIANILNPFESDLKLRSDIERYCFQEMSELLRSTASSFQNAHIAVMGYYPIITRHTPVKRIVNDVLELYNWPGWTKPLINNSVNRVLWRRYRRKMIMRSRIWHEQSTSSLQRAVDRANRSTGDERVIFVPAPFADEHGYGAPKTFLWKVASKGRAADPASPERKAACRPALDELRRETNLKYRTRVCELASIGHPNAAGSAAIATALRKTLEPRLRDTSF